MVGRFYCGRLRSSLSQTKWSQARLCGRGEISVVLISDLNNTRMQPARKTQKNEKKPVYNFYM